MRLPLKILIYLLSIHSFLIPMFGVYGQDATPGNPTQLDEVIIYGLKSIDFANGSHQLYLDSTLEKSPSASLSNILQKHSAVYLKEYGNQMLSTITLRGSSPGHTATLWNGMNINSPTLGQFDFSQAPAIITDRLILHYGGSSALFGNEAMGGAVVLESVSHWEDHPSLLFSQEIGSFGTFNTRASYRISSRDIESSTKAYFSRTENDFSYKNILLPGSPTQVQRNAENQQQGFAQDLYWQPGSGQEASLHMWYHQSDRQIQPAMANPNSEDTQEDKNLRLQASWQSAGSSGYLNARAGFLRDYLLFNNNLGTESNQFIFQANLGKEFSNKITANVGGSANHIVVNTDNYLRTRRENRWDTYIWLQYTPLDIWSLTANIRSSGATDFASPVSPSFGSALTFIQNKTTEITWKAQAGLNYKIPTLNDRYWNPGGNPALKPEKGFSLETGLQFDQSMASTSHKLDLSAYSMWIDNWIIWLPAGSYWSPENLRKVNSSGIEINASGQYKFKKTKATWMTSYAYTSSRNQTQLDPYDQSKGKQLPYIPYHNLSISLDLQRSYLLAGIVTNYTGERFTTTDNSAGLEDFWLVDLMLGYQLKIAILKIKARNLLNTTYYHLPLRPLPGRNYSLSITININQIR